MICPCGCGEEQSSMLDIAADQFDRAAPDLADRPGVVLVLTPTGADCDCGCKAGKVRVSMISHPYAVDDMADILPALFQHLLNIQRNLGEFNFKIAELRRAHEAAANDD